MCVCVCARVCACVRRCVCVCMCTARSCSHCCCGDLECIHSGLEVTVDLLHTHSESLALGASDLKFCMCVCLHIRMRRVSNVFVCMHMYVSLCEHVRLSMDVRRIFGACAFGLLTSIFASLLNCTMVCVRSKMSWQRSRKESRRMNSALFWMRQGLAGHSAVAVAL